MTASACRELPGSAFSFEVMQSSCTQRRALARRRNAVSKQNTVAVGAYHNSRDGGPQPDVAAEEAAEARRLDYATVVAVAPVTDKADLFATVIGAEPVRETTTATTPRQVCQDVVVQERLPERDG